jgi:hypothetical protein
MTAQNPKAATSAEGGPTEENISTENQPKGAARNPSDTLDRGGTDQNAGAKPGGEAAGGNASRSGDPTSPAAADAAAAKQDRAQAARGLGDDGPRSNQG